MAHAHIQRLKKAQADLVAALAKSRQNEATQAEALTDLVAIMKSSNEGRRLVIAYLNEVEKQNRSDISGAILTAISGTPGMEPLPIAKAVAESFNPPVQKAAEPEPTPEEQAIIETIAGRARKVRADIKANDESLAQRVNG